MPGAIADKMRGFHAWRELAVVAAVWVALIGLATYFIALQRAADRAALRSQTLQAAAALRAHIESELNATAVQAQGLVAYIRARGPLGEDHVERAMAALFAGGKHIRNIGIAPQNKIAYVYPKSGNEAALGVRYEDRPDQWPGVRRAMETGHAVLAGPIDLVQGGRALVNRAPVFLNGGDDYWGMVSVVIDLDSFLRDVGLYDPESPVRVALLGSNGVGDEAVRIAGDPGVLEASPLRMRLEIPGGTWELAAVPVQGWAGSVGQSWLLPYLAYGSAVALTVLLWLALKERIKVREARAELLRLNQHLAAANQELERLSETDPLTDIPNRRGLDEVLAIEWRRCRRHLLPVTLLAIDVDLFKSYNDAYGHIKGDECLKRVVAAMQATATRAGEFVARTGGEEFVMVLPGIGADEARAQAERVRAAVEHAAIVHEASTVSRHVTVSVGVATREAQSSIALDALREAADAALYEAKHAGRNCVRVAPTEDGTIED